MKNKYHEDDSFKPIPDYIKNMTSEELDKAINDILKKDGKIKD